MASSHRRTIQDLAHNDVVSIRTTTTKRQKKIATAKNAVRWLILYLLSNLSLTLAIVVLFGSGRRYRALQNKPIWFPPLWLIHSATLASSFLMGLSGWLVWANGGFLGGGYYSEALPVYVAQISLGFTWHPLVLRIGAAHLGVAYCLVNLGTLVSCYVNFGKVNSVAGDLVKPCLAWALYLSFVTFKLNFL